jgi:hypothetical protein
MSNEPDVQILNNPIYKRLVRISHVLEEAAEDIEAIPRTPLLSHVMKTSMISGIKGAAVTVRTAMRQMSGEI